MTNNPTGLRMIVFTLLAALFLTLSACSNQVLSLMKRQVTQTLTADPVGELPDGLHVLVCGAGGPLPAANRSPACLLVIAGETAMLFDAGGGAARGLGLNGFAPPLVERVFLTHFHSDHIDGLGEVATLRWAGGPWKSPLAVHGPHGVAEIVSGFNLAYRRDQTYRTAHHGLEVTPPNDAVLSSAAFSLPAAGTRTTVFEKGPLRVEAFAVNHEPVSPAVGYRVQYKDRSIAISGDTAKSENLIAQTKGVDVLFHEALSKVLVGVMNEAAREAGRPQMEKITADILDYHASPVEAAESAEAVDADALVLYHVVPPLPIGLLEGVFMEGVEDAFSGETVLSEDGTFISLPAGSDAIEVEAP